MNEKINQWIAFIDNNDRELVKMAEKKNKTLEKARVEMNYLTGDAEVRRLAELREKWERDYIDARINGKKEGLTEGMKQGLEDGLKQGVEEGIKQGLEKGMKQEKINIAKEMKHNNFPVELIEKMTGLSKEEITQIQ